MFQAQVFTLYPEVFPGPLSKGLYGKALSNKLWNLSVINIRDAATDKHKTVDDTPYGGGTGMLLKADVLASALDQKVKKEERWVCFLWLYFWGSNSNWELRYCLFWNFKTERKISPWTYER